MKNKIYKLEEAVNEDKMLIGGKGYHIAQLIKLKEELNLSFDVPGGYVLPTSVWKNYKNNPKEVIKDLKENIIPTIVKGMSDKNGFPMVSVRSGAPVSMPGMMDTILNLGINEENIDKYEKIDKDWAYDCYKRYLTMYGEIALGINKEELQKIRKKNHKTIKSIKDDYEKIYKNNKKELPKDDIENQLFNSIIAVLDSWDNERAVVYRDIEKIDNNLGTAIIIQKMVFGNLNENSATAVVFSRDTNNGSTLLTGEFLCKAQGEDVVSGSATPNDIYDMKEWNEKIFNDIKKDVKALEVYFKDVQDIELTIENGKLYFLQTRNAKRTPAAGLKIAMDMEQEGLISKEEIFNRVSLKDYLSLNNRQIDPGYKKASDAVGLSASSGVLSGRIVFDLRGTELIEPGEPSILFAEETTPDDMAVLKEVSGVVTCVGGVTSHAAVVARSLNKVAIVGCGDIKIHNEGKREDWYIDIAGEKLYENDVVTVDGESGRIWIGNDVPIIDGNDNKNLLKIEDMIFEMYPFVRAVSDPNDIFCDKNIVYATYKLDTEVESEIKEKLFTAIEIIEESEPEDYLAIIDMRGKLDFINDKDEEVPFTKSLSVTTIEKKLEALLDWSGSKNKFKVYLGDYEDEYKEKLIEYGFNIANKKELEIELGKNVVVKENQKFLTIVDRLTKENIEKPSKKLVISGKNALISLLRK